MQGVLPKTSLELRHMSSPGARAPGPPRRPQHAQLSKAPGNGALSRFALMLDEPMPAVINRGPND
jgi:hypothetical protein